MAALAMPLQSEVIDVETVNSTPPQSFTRKLFARRLWVGVTAFAALSVACLLGTTAVISSGPKLSSFGLSLNGDTSSVSTGRELQESAEACEEPYGFLPCSSSLGGNLFLMVAYGYILLVAAKLISEGSEMLLQVLNPGIIGGLLLPILGAFPDTLLIAVSGIGGTAEEAQEQVLVGMGVLAGSTIMILTLAWGGSLIFGRCDLTGPNGTAKDRTLTRGFSLLGTGVTTDEQTQWGAWIMIASGITYVIVQIPLIDGRETVDGSTSALVGMIVAFSCLVAYCTYQVASPWLQEIRIENARLFLIKTVALQGLHSMAATKSWGGLLTEDGAPNTETLLNIFHHFDENGDGSLQKSEIKALIIGIGMQHQGSVPNDEEVETWLAEFDKDEDGFIGTEEFVKGMTQWVTHVTKHANDALEKRKLDRTISTLGSALGEQTEAAKTALALFEEEELEEAEEDEPEKVLTPAQIYREAFILMFLGAALVAVFADPMVDAISNFSTASGIPAFFVAFVVTPIASNASELVSSLLFAMKKKKRTISLTYSQVYGAITMNNTMCLGVFLAIVYFRGLTWEFSSEVAIILSCTAIVGIIGGMATTFKTWIAIFVLGLYPISIGVVAFLDYVLGWQ